MSAPRPCGTPTDSGPCERPDGHSGRHGCGQATRRDTVARSRAQVLAEMSSDPRDRRHGTVYGFRVGCRCDPCKTVNRAYHTAYHRARSGS